MLAKICRSFIYFEIFKRRISNQPESHSAHPVLYAQTLYYTLYLPTNLSGLDIYVNRNRGANVDRLSLNFIDLLWGCLKIYNFKIYIKTHRLKKNVLKAY